jgi:hypothetical protein
MGFVWAVGPGLGAVIEADVVCGESNHRPIALKMTDRNLNHAELTLLEEEY